MPGWWRYWYVEKIEEDRNILLLFFFLAFLTQKAFLLFSSSCLSIPVLVMFAMIKLLSAGTWRTDALACVAATLLKWPMQQSISEESPIWAQMGGNESHAALLIFVFELIAVLAWAHVSLSSGGDRWQLDHANKFAVMLGLFVFIHNPVSSAVWQPLVLEATGLAQLMVKKE